MDKKEAKREKKGGGGFFSVFTACSGKHGKKETSVKTPIEEGAAGGVCSELVVNSSKTSEQHNVFNQISAEGESQEVELSKSLEQIDFTLKETPLQSPATNTDEGEDTASVPEDSSDLVEDALPMQFEIVQPPVGPNSKENSKEKKNGPSCETVPEGASRFEQLPSTDLVEDAIPMQLERGIVQPPAEPNSEEKKGGPSSKSGTPIPFIDKEDDSDSDSVNKEESYGKKSTKELKIEGDQIQSGPRSLMTKSGVDSKFPIHSNSKKNSNADISKFDFVHMKGHQIQLGADSVMSYSPQKKRSTSKDKKSTQNRGLKVEGDQIQSGPRSLMTKGGVDTKLPIDPDCKGTSNEVSDISKFDYVHIEGSQIQLGADCIMNSSSHGEESKAEQTTNIPYKGQGHQPSPTKPSSEDYGGPRKEFFQLILQEIQTELFQPVRELSPYYESAGKILALSILQNGPLPQFLDDPLRQELLRSDQPRPIFEALRKGLDALGMYKLMKKLPQLEFLLIPNSNRLTVKKITNLLKPEFSELHSNARTVESQIFQKFISYLRDVASGRRKGLTLERILAFVTGSEREPSLGFTIHPSISFKLADKESPRYIPTANTCINQLHLFRPEDCRQALPSDSKLFDSFDLAFSNTFFGQQ
ncbi:hypothetical protein ScPMuIL_010288 [Solemya velum]